MQQLEGFQYATALDLNTGYYTLRLLYDSQDMTTIVTEFWKFRYSCPTMGICVLGEIIQDKSGDLLGDIGGLKKIDDVLVLSKETLSKKI